MFLPLHLVRSNQLQQCILIPVLASSSTFCNFVEAVVPGGEDFSSHGVHLTTGLIFVSNN